MSVLLIRLRAPLQSWGSSSRFSQRKTESRPTKSGVIGMIAAALGMKRTDSLERFDGLRFGVRVDQPGKLLSDFQTAHNDRGDSMPLSWRQYLADAAFLVGLEDDSENGRKRLNEYADALRSPYYPLYLGRRSCPPDGPVKTWIVDGSLKEALYNAPWQATERYQKWSLRTSERFPRRLSAEIFIETEHEDTTSNIVQINDSPKSYDPRRREWVPRYQIRVGTVCPEPTVQVEHPSASAGMDRQFTDTDYPADNHDPLSAIMAPHQQGSKSAQEDRQ